MHSYFLNKHIYHVKIIIENEVFLDIYTHLVGPA